METYTALRAFADSWHLLFMFLFFIGVVLFVFRRGSRKVQDETANQIFRNEDRPAPAPEERKPQVNARSEAPGEARGEGRSEDRGEARSDDGPAAPSDAGKPGADGRKESETR